MSQAVEFSNVTADMPIIGFTGALGSGCTFLANGLARHHDYFYCSLSTLIHDVASQEGLEETSDNLQNVGNWLRREYGLDALVRWALQDANEEIGTLDEPSRPVGLVVDGIRNTAEIEPLRQWPHFYLISVQAEEETRKKRLLDIGRCEDAEEFEAADQRDRDEYTPDGQQVRRCNYQSDVIIINEEPVPEVDECRHVKKKLYERYVSPIEHFARGETPAENIPTQMEALMTAAYAESRRSSCLKRKVGAVIAGERSGAIIAAGHNDVPPSSTPCIRDPRYNGCARDVIQEDIAQSLRFCPGCGEPVVQKVECLGCGKELDEFVKLCPECGRETDFDCVCNNEECGVDIFANFLPGADADRTGKLLDICRSLHAEENAILTIAKVGARLDEDAVLYSTTFPCNLCANKIVGVGIKKVVYAEPYEMAEAKKVFDEEGVKLVRFEGVKSRAYFRFYS